MDKKKKWLKITLGIMALVIVGVYIGGIAAFHGKFLKNTDINGMDVSDMTVEEAEKLIREQAEDYQITLKNAEITVRRSRQKRSVIIMFPMGKSKISKNPSHTPCGL